MELDQLLHEQQRWKKAQESVLTCLEYRLQISPSGIVTWKWDKKNMSVLYVSATVRVAEEVKESPTVKKLSTHPCSSGSLSLAMAKTAIFVT